MTQSFTCAIRTPSGNYVTAVNGGGMGDPPYMLSPIHTNARLIGPWEQFRIYWIDPLRQRFALQTANGHYVTMVNGGGMGEPANQYPIHTDATQIGLWETFTFIELLDGKYGIQTSGGFYLSAVNGGGMGEPANQYPIHTDAMHIGAWEILSSQTVPVPILV